MFDTWPLPLKPASNMLPFSRGASKAGRISTDHRKLGEGLYDHRPSIHPMLGARQACARASRCFTKVMTTKRTPNPPNPVLNNHVLFVPHSSPPRKKKNNLTHPRAAPCPTRPESTRPDRPNRPLRGTISSKSESLPAPKFLQSAERYKTACFQT